MRRHWINKLFVQNHEGVTSLVPSALVYITDAYEKLIIPLYINKEGMTCITNPLLSSEQSVLEFWTESEIDFVLLVIIMPYRLPAWFTWTHGNDPKYIVSSGNALERICTINGIEI